MPRGLWPGWCGPGAGLHPIDPASGKGLGGKGYSQGHFQGSCDVIKRRPRNPTSGYSLALLLTLPQVPLFVALSLVEVGSPCTWGTLGTTAQPSARGTGVCLLQFQSLLGKVGVGREGECFLWAPPRFSLFFLPGILKSQILPFQSCVASSGVFRGGWVDLGHSRKILHSMPPPSRRRLIDRLQR